MRKLSRTETLLILAEQEQKTKTKKNIQNKTKNMYYIFVALNKITDPSVVFKLIQEI